MDINYIKLVIKENFGVYVTKSEIDAKGIIVYFIPVYVISILPSEYRRDFIMGYNKFAEWALRELKIEELYNKYVYDPIDDTLFAKIKDELINKINKRRANGEMELYDILLGFLGIGISKIKN